MKLNKIKLSAILTSMLLRFPAVARVLDEIFLSLWNGPYVQRLDPEKEYSPPRIKQIIVLSN